MIRSTCLSTLVTTLIALVVLSGCSLLSREPTKYYLLDESVPHAAELAVEGAALSKASEKDVVIGPVSLPGYLDRRNIVIQTAPYTYKISDYHLWAEPLEAVIGRKILRSQRWEEVGLWASTESSSKDRRILHLELSRFHVRSDNPSVVVIEGEWLLRKGTTRRVIPFISEVECKSASERAIREGVDCLSRALEREVAKLTSDLAG